MDGTEVAQLQGHLGNVTALAVHPNGCVISGSSDMTVRIWTAEELCGPEPLRSGSGSMTDTIMYPVSVQHNSPRDAPQQPNERAACFCMWPLW